MKMVKIGDGLEYSLLYSVEEDNDTYAVDWDQHEKKWTSSRREYGLGHGWERLGEIDQKAYNALLEHFGLQNRADEFPLESIVTTSPADLAKAGGKNPESSTLGDSRSASDVDK